MIKIQYTKNGSNKTLMAKQDTTLDDLMEWQERHILFPGFESISIIINGKIYSTLEA